METEYYFGTRFDNVRIELTQGANIQKSGMEDASSCIVKIPNNNNLPKPYMPPKPWEKLTTEEMLKYFSIDKNEDFFLIVKKKDLGIDIGAPVGFITSDDYGGFFDYCKSQYGYTFIISTVDIYNLIPRFEIGGK